MIEERHLRAAQSAARCGTWLFGSVADTEYQSTLRALEDRQPQGGFSGVEGVASVGCNCNCLNLCPKGACSASTRS